VEELGIPPQLNEIAGELNGIVLVTGPTGSGKSTTLAAIINKINREKPIHVITIEDPIEYLHPHATATINQREVGSDTGTFALALRAALRQAPKVILVGEMRDVETISIALEASETGHLVLSTLHTIDASKTIDRIVGVFPKNEERQIRTRFSQSFKWIVSQRLVPKAGGGRKALCEILRSNSRTREYIQEGEREGKSLMEAMEDGHLEGMQSFDQELEKCINNGELERETALSYATNRANLQIRLDTQGVGAEEKVKAGSVKMAAPPPAPRKPAAPATGTTPRRSDSEFEDLIER
jgi:twitching motility protein PilT